MIRAAVNGGDTFIADDKAADIAALFLDVLLDVENRVVVTAEHGLVFEHGFRRVAIVDLGQQATPGTDCRLQHHRVAQFLDRLECRLLGKGDPALRLRDAVILERRGGQQFVTADLRYLVRIDATHAGAFEQRSACSAREWLMERSTRISTSGAV